MKVDKDVLALSLLSAGEVAHSFSSFMPSRFTLSNWVLDGTDAEVQVRLRSFRAGYLPAVAWGIGLSAVVSVVAESALPLLFGTGTAAAMVALYEQGIPPERRLLSGQKRLVSGAVIEGVTYRVLDGGTP